MGTREVGMPDVRHGPPSTRLRLLGPLRYLAIHHPEKTQYDLKLPAIIAAVGCAAYWLIEPKPALFGETGLLKFVRDLLIMAVPFMVGALASVAMGSPGSHLDRRPIGDELFLDGRMLTLRQFVCYLLGYLCLVSVVVLLFTVGATLMRDTVVAWVAGMPAVRVVTKVIGTMCLSLFLSVLTVTVLWSLYFLTVIVNDVNNKK